MPRGASRALGALSQGREVAVISAQKLAEVAWDRLVDGLYIDDLLALDDAQMQSAVCFKTDYFHDHSLT